MRLAGQQKAGFFPCPPEAMAYVARFIAAADPSTTTILDPCCGKGAAINQLAAALKIPGANVFAAELDNNRVDAARELMPAATIAGPCDFLQMEASSGWASAAWVNPPYDDEINGGMREEETFFRHACDCVRPEGIILLALPESVISTRYDLQNALLCRCETLTMIRYPSAHRRFREAVVIGRKRKARSFSEKDQGHDAWRKGVKQVYTDTPGILPDPYIVPPGLPPRRFAKASYTPLEIAAAMHLSPLKKLFSPPKPKPQPRPGLQLGANQRALVLAGGMLNTVLAKPSGERILIKGSSYKEDFIKEKTEEMVETREGPQVKTTTVISQKICLRVRALDKDGVIHDLK